MKNSDVAHMTYAEQKIYIGILNTNTNLHLLLKAYCEVNDLDFEEYEEEANELLRDAIEKQ